MLTQSYITTKTVCERQQGHAKDERGCTQTGSPTWTPTRFPLCTPIQQYLPAKVIRARSFASNSQPPCSPEAARPFDLRNVFLSKGARGSAKSQKHRFKAARTLDGKPKQSCTRYMPHSRAVKYPSNFTFQYVCKPLSVCPSSVSLSLKSLNEIISHLVQRITLAWILLKELRDEVLRLVAYRLHVEGAKMARMYRSEAR